MPPLQNNFKDESQFVSHDVDLAALQGREDDDSWLGSVEEANFLSTFPNSSIDDSFRDIMIITRNALLLPLSILLVSIDLWIVVAILTDWRLRNISNYFLANLAVSELAFVALVFFDVKVREDAGSVHCSSTLPYLLVTVSLITSYFLGAICLSVDKYLKISRPLRYTALVTRRVFVVSVIGAWSLALVAGILTSTLVEAARECSSVVDFFSHIQLGFVVFSHVVIVPTLAVTVGLNIGVIRIARRQARAIANMTIPQQNLPDSTNNNATTNEQQQQKQPKQEPQLGKKSTRHFMAFLWSFVLVWLPQVIVDDIFYGVARDADNDTVVWFVAVRSAMNAAGLVQMIYGSFALTLKQEQFQTARKRHWMTIKRTFKVTSV